MRIQIEEVFHAVADLSMEDRARYFVENGIAEDIRREVEQLMVFDKSASVSLEREIGRVALGTLEHLEPKGLSCGPYRLERLLGRGGMGSVYSAERVDGEVSQRVAVKLLRPGADDPGLRERFLAERQILATVSHPNIARLLDAGHREDGQPYLVMEHVEGKPIDVYAAGLSTQRKISLLLKVCSAVSYLHKHLIVHRDLKPANILVAHDGEPKLLDFGIAKLLDLTTDSTSTGMRMLTPDYASPEQVAGGPITTATDIYLLGAVLYKLLTNTAPHQLEEASAGAIAMAIAGGNITPPSKLAPAVSSDLESIVMKAMRKEPQDRYSSVDALSEDLRASLEGHPVQARSGEVWYRARRLARRHWAFGAAAVVVVASLSMGLYLANRQRTVAERRFEQLRHLSNRVIDLDRAIYKLPGSMEARRGLVAASLEYLEGLSREARGNSDLSQEIADGYWRLARIQGGNTEFSLGDSKKAEECLKKADLLMESVLVSHPADRNALIRSALIAQDRMIAAYAEGRRADVFLHLLKAVQRIEEFQQHEDPLHPIRLEGVGHTGDLQSERYTVASVYVNIALMAVNMRSYADAARLARRATAIARSIAAGESLACEALSIEANALRFQGDLESALNAIREARAFSERATYQTPAGRLFRLYGPIVREGRILGEADAINLGRAAEAVEVLQKALDITEEVAGNDPLETASRIRLGETAWTMGDILRDLDPRRSLAIYDLGILRLGEARNSVQARRNRAALLANSSYPLRRLHRTAEAKARLDTALAMLRDTHDYPVEQIRLDSHAEALATALADHEAEAGDAGRGLEMYRDLLAKVMAGGAKPDAVLPDATSISRIYGAIAGLSRRTGGNTRAADFEARRLKLWQQWDAKLPRNDFVARQIQEASAAVH